MEWWERTGKFSQTTRPQINFFNLISCCQNILRGLFASKPIKSAVYFLRSHQFTRATSAVFFLNTFNCCPWTTMALACRGSTSSTGMFRRVAISSTVSVPGRQRILEGYKFIKTITVTKTLFRFPRIQVINLSNNFEWLNVTDKNYDSSLGTFKQHFFILRFQLQYSLEKNKTKQQPSKLNQIRSN